MNERKAQPARMKVPVQAPDASTALLSEMEKAVVGKRGVLELLLTALLAGGHVLLEDVPGVGKTTIAAAMARAAGLRFRRVQFTPDVLPSDIVGFYMYNRATGSFDFKPGAVMCHILLADEINRTSPKTQSSLLEVMEEGRVTVEGHTIEVPNPFMVIATQNPLGYIGTHPLPEAQLDRFMLRLRVGYPSMRDEIAMLSDRLFDNPLEQVRSVLSAEMLLSLREQVRGIFVDPKLRGYIVRLVGATREHPLLSLGGSPRASVALMRAAQAQAFLRGRDFCTPEDIARMYIHVLAHRVVLSTDARMKNTDADALLGDVLSATPTP